MTTWYHQLLIAAKQNIHYIILRLKPWKPYFIEKASGHFDHDYLKRRKERSERKREQKFHITSRHLTDLVIGHVTSYMFLHVGLSGVHPLCTELMQLYVIAKQSSSSCSAGLRRYKYNILILFLRNLNHQFRDLCVRMSKIPPTLCMN